jgi:hypothetical protein
MDHRKTRGVGYGLLLIGPAVGAISLITVLTQLADRPASILSFRSERIVNPVDAAPSAASHDRLGNRGARDTVSSNTVNRHDHGGERDARLDLQDAAAMARWYLWTRPGRGETRTDLWINAPASIGSTSPSDPSPAIRFPEE